VLLLALDTSSPAVSVAVHDASTVVAQASEIAEKRHGELLAPMIGDVIAQADCAIRDLTQVVVGVGPGPYTSLRIGLVTAHALALADGVPVHGICSLDALAAEAADRLDTQFLVATDARRREVYWAVYAPDGRRVHDPAVGTAAAVRGLFPDLPVVGAGADLYPELLGPRIGPQHPSAVALAHLAVSRVPAGEALPARPLYLRRPDAALPTARKAVLP
jgi:tRNA threonylcarbamoyl adenosine modification protein YeaZ